MCLPSNHFFFSNGKSFYTEMNFMHSITNSKSLLSIRKGYDVESISKIMMSMLLYSACSVSMLFVNKIALNLAGNEVHFVLLIQNLASVLLFRFLEYWEFIKIENIEKDLKLRLITVVSFVLMLVSSMKARKTITLRTHSRKGSFSSNCCNSNYFSKLEFNYCWTL